MTIYNRPVQQTYYPNQIETPTPKWLEQKQPKESIIKKIFKWVLSIFYGVLQSILFVAWLIVGMILASNYYEPFNGLKNAILSIWQMIAIIIAVYFSWSNYGALRR